MATQCTSPGQRLILSNITLMVQICFKYVAQPGRHSSCKKILTDDYFALKSMVMTASVNWNEAVRCAVEVSKWRVCKHNSMLIRAHGHPCITSEHKADTFFANMTPLGYELLIHVNMKIVFFQDVTKHSSIDKYQCCIRTQNHHLQYRRWRHPSSSTTLLTMHQISWHHITE